MLAVGTGAQEGQRYRITLETPRNWFDRAIRADVAGFTPGSFSLLSATPLKRWWREDWFRPIARIGEIGNDEYVLAPKDEFEKYEYPSCPQIERQTDGTSGRAKIPPDVAEQLMKCAPTPENRNKVVAEIKARTTGELFLYVNDAVLMLPGLTDFFVSNNTGTATVSVDRAEQPPGAAR